MARKTKTAGPAVQWKSRAQIVRTPDAIYHRLESVDGRYMLIKTESLLAGPRGYPDRWTPYRVGWISGLSAPPAACPFSAPPAACPAPARLYDAAGHLVEYEVSRRIKSRRAANQQARELAMRACCLHARGEPIPPPRKPVNRRQLLRRAVQRIEAAGQ